MLDTLPETFTATNAARFVRGEEAEADEDLRDRAQGLWQTAARGTEKALIQGAREVGIFYSSGVQPGVLGCADGTKSCLRPASPA